MHQTCGCFQPLHRAIANWQLSQERGLTHSTPRAKMKVLTLVQCGLSMAQLEVGAESFASHGHAGCVAGSL